ncbi:TIGR00730 family Rossman fold protein [Christensenella timonensis]|uniref:LOG family protein n=1 Tax=Christensenella timonensis TaxID=1816678 RepID=UPI000831F11F|nr:TIGR00730 family Rossman fold protein [Christensenella timonensis]
MKKICVFGSSSSVLDQSYFDDAFLVGKLIAENGWEMVFGAGDMGMMGHAARGVKSAGGRITGVLPEFMNLPGIPFEDCDELIVSPSMRERKFVMEEMADAFIVTAGGFGTFEELCEVITLKQLKRHEKAIVILNTNGFYDEMIAMFEKSVAQRFAKEEALSVYEVVKTPGEAVDAIKNYKYQAMGSKWFTPDAP